MDNKDIYALCDDNVIYEISLKQSIERDLLVPFRYHAIYDATDYDQVKMSGGRYVIEDLENQLSHGIRADLIIDNYRKFAGDRTLGFCVSIKHAEYIGAASHGVNAAQFTAEKLTLPYGDMVQEALKVRMLLFCSGYFTKVLTYPPLTQ